MSYYVKEVYTTLQGEGLHTGRPAVFLRFTGCNLWSGLEGSRPHAVCKFCDTDFVGGKMFRTAKSLADWVLTHWEGDGKRFVVCTGGEPLLQLDDMLIDALHKLNFEIAVETNGTIPQPTLIDWLTVSPKTEDIVIHYGDELKLVYPQKDLDPEMFEHKGFDYFFLQPMHNSTENIKLAMDYCSRHPQWRLSLQTHKILGIR